ncbi:MAG: HlyD family secretion protein [Acidiferrobacteraceae bacterium]
MTLKGSARRNLLLAAIGLLAALAGFAYWRYDRRFVSTDDGYIGAHVIRIAAQIPGAIRTVDVRDSQAVRAGQLLFTIESRPYVLKVREAQALLAQARGALRSAKARLQAARAGALQSSIELGNAERTFQRTATLAARHYVSQQALDNARAQLARVRAGSALSQAQLRESEITLRKKEGVPARIRAAKAELAAAKLDLSYTRVSAPSAGIISNLNLRPGSVVTPLMPLFALVEQGDYWVNANFKETDIERIRDGDPAQIDVDMYPGHTFRGRVESISGAAGTAFSLLPPENATGNWVKVTQRVPVRIHVLNPDPRYPLRVGTSASVTVRVLR